MKHSLAFTLLSVVVLCLIEGAVQWNSHAWTASFGSYPDEPSHFLSALLVRDYVVDGHGNPLEFARNYYTYHPYFAIGYWPPLFYLFAATWMVVFGYSRLSVMIFTGGVAVVVAMLLYETARRTLLREVGDRMATAWALPTAVFFLLIPSVRWSSSIFMVDLTVAALSLMTTLMLGRFFQNPTSKRAILAGLLAGGVLLTKYSGAFVLLPPAVLMVLDRRWKLLRRPPVWLLAGMIGLTWGPWLYWSRRFTTIGLDNFQREVFWPRLRSAYESLNADFGSIFGACVVLVLIGGWLHWKQLTDTQKLLVLQLPSVMFFIFLAPVTIEQRYLLTAYPALLCLLPWMIYRCFDQYPRLLRGGPLLFAGIIALYAAGHPSNLAPLQTELPRQIARDLLASQDSDSAILVATPVEGPVIAELAGQETHRPGILMIRSSKLLARMNWLGTQYETREPNVEGVREIFSHYPIDTVLLCERTGMEELPHDRQLRAMLEEDATSWQRTSSYTDADGSRYALYRRPHGPAQSLQSLTSYIRDRLPRAQ